MFSKKSFFENRAEERATKRLRSNVSDLYLSGTLSGFIAASLFNDANEAGAAEVDGAGAGI